MVKWSFLALFSCLVLASFAQAEPKKLSAQQMATAADLFKKADEHYQLQEYDVALAYFKELYRLSAEPSLLFNIAQCQRNLGDLGEAQKSFKSFIREDPNNVLRKTAEKYVRELQVAIEQAKKMGTIDISCDQSHSKQSLSLSIFYFLLLFAGGSQILH